MDETGEPERMARMLTGRPITGEAGVARGGTCVPGMCSFTGLALNNLITSKADLCTGHVSDESEFLRSVVLLASQCHFLQ